MRPPNAVRIYIALTAASLLLVVAALWRTNEQSGLQVSTVGRATFKMRTSSTCDCEQCKDKITCTDASACLQNTTVTEATCKCLWGNLEGIWQPYNSAGSRWFLLAPQCFLRNLLTKYANASACSEVGHAASSAQQAPGDTPGMAANTYGPPALKAGIMFLGDSSDHYLQAQMCKRLPGAIDEGGHYDRNILHICKNACTGLDMGMWYIPGVSMSGPYNEKLVGSAIDRTELAYKAWQSQFGQKPDLVVLSSNLWDIPIVRETAKLLSDPQTNATDVKWVDGNSHWVQVMTPEYAQSWTANFTAWVQHARSINPTALHIYRTAGLPKWDYSTGLTADPALLHVGLVHTFNALGRQASNTLDLPIVDFEKMASGLPPAQYLADAYHTNEWLHTEAFNIMLNYLESHINPQSNTN